MTHALLLVLVAATGGGQATPLPTRLLSAAEFGTAPKAEKRATLNALASHRFPSPPEDVGYLIEAGLLDADEDVRWAAVYAAAGRAAGARFGLDKTFIETWNAERPVLLRLRPLVLKTLGDADPRVRQGAIIALGNMDHDPALNSPDIRLHDDTAAALVARLDVETNPSVRTELAKSLALTQPDPRTDHRLLPLLEDLQVDVLKYAITGLAASKMPEALQRLPALLKHRDSGVRLQVAQALAAYRSASAPYLTQIEEALAVEQDAIVRQTLDGTLAIVRNAAKRGK